VLKRLFKLEANGTNVPRELGAGGRGRMIHPVRWGIEVLSVLDIRRNTRGTS